MVGNLDLLKLIEWSAVQAHIQIAPQNQYLQQRQMWWASIGQNIGVETNGKNYHFERPVLILKVFNPDSAFVVPLTSTVTDHPFLIKFEQAGSTMSANIFQLRTLSTKRFGRMIGEINESDFNMIMDSIQKLLFTNDETPQSRVS